MREQRSNRATSARRVLSGRTSTRLRSRLGRGSQYNPNTVRVVFSRKLVCLKGAPGRPKLRQGARTSKHGAQWCAQRVLGCASTARQLSGSGAPGPNRVVPKGPLVRSTRATRPRTKLRQRWKALPATLWFRSELFITISEI